MNESGWWSFLYFMGAGRERETGTNQRSAKRETNQPPASWEKRGGGDAKNPRQLERQWVAKKKPPASWKKKQWVAKKRPPASWKKRQWVAKKNPPTLAARTAQGQGQCAHVQSQKTTNNSETKLSQA